ncbi:MAG: hypothetical protein JO276_07560 [Sphingomonadaceae bacterium]|nr:hypothetical protein [Sphingomonadaceae bacterium]
MAKSRTALILLAQLAASWSVEADAQDASPLTPEERVAAYNARIRAGMGSVAGARYCPRDAEGDTIVVCGRDESARQRLPFGSPPVEGQRHRLIAGEAPSATGALDVGRACCGSGGGINVLGIIGALGRGADRILHPD